MPTATDLRTLIDALALVDHHCHGVVTDELDRDGFEELMTESPFPPPPGTSHFDTPFGLVVRRWCAPLLDLPAHCEPERYLDRRRELGAAEVNRRLLRAAGTELLLVETGYQPQAILEPDELAAAAGAAAAEVVRIEAVMERTLAEAESADAFAAGFGARLAERAASAVGLKTIVAYRGGFAFDPAPPGRAEVVEAAGRWLSRSAPGQLTDPTLLRFGIWTGVELASQRHLPIQLHSGLGDTDLTLHLANPSLLTDLIKRLQPLGVDLTLLHCYPYHREAAYLAAVFPNVYLDVGLALNYTGPSAARVLAETMELAPFTKHLYSSDAFGLAELYHAGALLFRHALTEVLAGWVGQDVCDLDGALRIARLIASENARRLYHLTEASTRDITC
jgi:uncharacterized protein